MDYPSIEKHLKVKEASKLEASFVLVPHENCAYFKLLEICI